jgi:predicted membrane channel-forming protein YqfA (hemolysin III family)
MRKWGIVLTGFYVVILLGLIVPGAMFVAGGDFSNWPGLIHGMKDLYGDWAFCILVVAVVGSQALLLFLSVDTSQKRLKPRTHIMISCTVAAILTALLTSAVIWALGFAIRGDKFWESFLDKEANLVLFWGGLWLAWGVIFYLYFRNSSTVVNQVLSWLLKGSILELLIVVPCHVIVRRRQDCSAPAATSFGIATGIAVMLLSFGPSVLFLYKKRLDEYAARKSAS